MIFISPCILYLHEIYEAKHPLFWNMVQIYYKKNKKTQVQWQKFTEEGTITYHNLANETDKHTTF